MTETTRVVQINYWKEIRKDIQKTIGKLNGLVLLTHNSVEFFDIVDFLNNVRRDEDLNVLYISLINSYSQIKNVLKEKPLFSKKLFVVDCVSGFLVELQDSIDCVYRRPPESLEEMKDLIVTHIQISDSNMIVVDSLSQFINFSMPNEADLNNFYHFLNTMKEKAISITTDTVILLYDDKMGSMQKLPSMFTNMILKLEVIKEKIKWND